MDLGLSNKTALVAGASRGISLGIARALAEEGARVAMTSRSRERVTAAAETIGAVGFEHSSGDLGGIDALVRRVETALGPIDILVTSTGGPPSGPDALGFARDEWESAYRDLLLSPMALIERVVPGMRQRRFGRVLSVSSSAVREPIAQLMLSNAHRAGLLAAFKTLARQLAAEGITFNSLLPGRIATERIFELMGGEEAAKTQAATMIPAGRLGTVAEIAAVAAFLCSEQASYVTGTATLVDGGLTSSI